MAMSHSQTLSLKGVAAKNTSLFLWRATSEHHQTWHGDKGGQYHVSHPSPASWAK